MPTPAERKALLFLAGVIVLGASVRVVRAARDDGSADADTRQALARQLAAVDSARTREGNRKGPKSPKKARGGSRPRGRLVVSSTDSSRTTGIVSSLTVVQRRASSARAERDTASPVSRIDLDIASEVDIERLPRIGPVLARRIVEDRTANGAFGSMRGFERVRGVGPALAALLNDRVTFSGTARPSNAIVDLGLRGSPPPPMSRRRERRR
jgi:DNA uptake protein ComE-like DNA-binding protein